jgi:hypothetical protein
MVKGIWPRGRGHLAFGVLVFVGVAWTSCRREPAVKQEAPQPAPMADGRLNLTTTRDPAEVFQRAFWRRPVPGDRILHAERREWSHSSDGVVRWQWFLAFEPAAGTREWLDGNPFGLAVVSSPVWSAVTAEAPPWFPRDLTGWGVEQKSGAGLTLLRSADGRRVFARDEGFGFAQAATR